MAYERPKDIDMTPGQRVRLTWTMDSDERTRAAEFWLYAAQRHFRIANAEIEMPSRDEMSVSLVLSSTEATTTQAMVRGIETLLIKATGWACGERPGEYCERATRVREYLSWPRAQTEVLP